MSWSNGLAEWIEGDTAYISVAFSWNVPKAFSLSSWYRSQNYKVAVGGPGTFVIGKMLNGVADQVGGDIPDAITKHNPDATIASRGCPVGCNFCIVPAMEGKEFTLLPEFTPRPILCDNNLSALPIEYQDYIIDKYQRYEVPLKDANSGFEPHSFDGDTYRRWKTINCGPWRFAYDETSEGSDVHRMTQILKDEPAYKKRVYVLIGNEPFESCYRRIMQVIEWGCEPHVQPMMSLSTTVKRPRIYHDWNERKLKNLARWANRWIWRKTPFDQYKYN